MSETVSLEQLAHWQSWIGKTEQRTEVLDAETLRRFAAATDADLNVEGAPPPLAHWAFFLPLANSADIGPDGHPKRGGFVPPVTLPRRMFAAADITLAGALALGAPAELEARITDLKHRTGNSGEMVFMEVERRISQRGTLRVQEQQTIVFRHAGERVPPVKPAPLPEAGGAQAWTPDRVDLFRFSAVTFNSHRIHYDAPYAIHDEGYPDLVVHGPFTAVKLFGYAQRQLGAPLTRFSFRATAPLFVGQPVRLCRGGQDNVFCAIRCDGAEAMRATVSCA